MSLVTNLFTTSAVCSRVQVLRMIIPSLDAELQKISF